MIWTLLELSNSLSAMLVGLVFLLALKGFAKRVPPGYQRELSAIWFRRALVLFLLKSLVRMSWWDIFWPALKNHQGLIIPHWMVSLINTGFNLMLLAAALCALKALYYNIPEHRRHQYSLMTAPWAPDTFRIWRIWK